MFEEFSCRRDDRLIMAADGRHAFWREANAAAFLYDSVDATHRWQINGEILFWNGICNFQNEMKMRTEKLIVPHDKIQSLRISRPYRCGIGG